jgi:hypothetical protein
MFFQAHLRIDLSLILEVLADLELKTELGFKVGTETGNKQQGSKRLGRISTNFL